MPALPRLCFHFSVNWGTTSPNLQKIKNIVPAPAYAQWRPHPWHGLDAGPNAPEEVRAFIEITPFDVVKYEVDKASGYLRVDRPQLTSSSPPNLYGFIPRTYCAEAVQALSPRSTHGDGDPMDICVISERPISHAEIILDARPIGGFQMVDAGEADDKIVAVLLKDPVWGGVDEIEDLPTALVERLRHYFLTYKLEPGGDNRVSIDRVYGRAHAHAVIRASMEDYRVHFPGI